MKRSRFSEEQIIGILSESDGAETIRQVCEKHNISEATYYAWKRKYGGMDISEARRLRALEEENARMKRVFAELSVQNHILKEVNAKNGKPDDQAPGGADEFGKRLGQYCPSLPGAWFSPLGFLPHCPSGPERETTACPHCAVA
ncbi:MAG: hypothetical protein SynsKO_22470 [Synoicihabitans sp.]